MRLSSDRYCGTASGDGRYSGRSAPYASEPLLPRGLPAIRRHRARRDRAVRDAAAPVERRVRRRASAPPRCRAPGARRSHRAAHSPPARRALLDDARSAGADHRRARVALRHDDGPLLPGADRDRRIRRPADRHQLRPRSTGRVRRGHRESLTIAAVEGFAPAELRKLRSLKDPNGIQRFMDAMPYHLATSAWSPRRVLKERTVHCLEGAIFAAAALRANGYPPLIVDLEADNDTDHVIAVYRERGHWGAIASSNYAGLRFREPIHRTLRELAISYWDGYFNLRGERTLRRFSRPVNLARFDRRDWMTSDEDVWFLPEDLLATPHTAILPPGMAH